MTCIKRSKRNGNIFQSDDKCTVKNTGRAEEQKQEEKVFFSLKYNTIYKICLARFKH